MTVTINNIDQYPHGAIVNAHIVSSSSCEELIPAPSAGKAIFVRHVSAITLELGVSINVDIGYGSVDEEIETKVIGPIRLNDGFKYFFRTFTVPAQFGESKPLVACASNNADALIQIEYYVNATR
jgi:hypothetical protein